MDSYPDARTRPDDPPARSAREEILDAYGGARAWRAATEVRAVLTCGGPFLTWKRGRGGHLVELPLVAEVHRQRIRFIGFHRGLDGVLEGQNVRLEAPDGTVVATRRNAHSRFPYGRRLFYWDALDMMYFLGSSTWNYVTFPALLMRDDITWTEQEGVLTAHFPPSLATPCPTQHFLFDDRTKLVTEHHYTAEMFGHRWPKARHLMGDYQAAGGLTFAGRRRVVPHGSGGLLPRPTLIWADVSGFGVTTPPSSANDHPEDHRDQLP